MGITTEMKMRSTVFFVSDENFILIVLERCYVQFRDAVQSSSFEHHTIAVETRGKSLLTVGYCRNSRSYPPHRAAAVKKLASFLRSALLGLGNMYVGNVDSM